MRGLLKTASSALLACATVVVAQDWPVDTYQTETFTTPQFTVDRQAQTNNGLLFLGYFKEDDPSKEAPMIVKDTGELVWRGPSGGPVYNFRRQVLNGEKVLTYWRGYLDYQGHGFGNVSILDQQYNEIDNICLPESEFIFNPRNNYPGDDPNPCYVDKHESLITDQGTILLTAYNATQMDLTDVGGKANGWVWDCLFYEMDIATREILFKWSAVDHVPATASNYVNKTAENLLLINGRQFGTKRQPWDYFHINSVQKIDGGYLINSRMTWSFYKIAQDKSIEWTLEGSNGGDFTYDKEVFFSWQHMPRVKGVNEGANTLQVQVFNNDNIPKVAQGKNTSTGYLFELNTETKEATVLRELIPETPIYAVAEGSYQDLANDHVLLGYGAIPIVQEFDENDQVIYTAQFGPNAEGAPHSYRAYRQPWTSTPNTKPKVVSFRDSNNKGQISAYMSWNGATEVDGWNVYAGPTAAKLSLVAANVPKTGFETNKSFKRGKKQFVMVEALKNGKGLANSTVEAVLIPE